MFAGVRAEEKLFSFYGKVTHQVLLPLCACLGKYLFLVLLHPTPLSDIKTFKIAHQDYTVGKPCITFLVS